MDVYGDVFAVPFQFTQGAEQIDSGLHIGFRHGVSRAYKSFDFDCAVFFFDRVDQGETAIGKGTQFFIGCVQANEVVVPEEHRD